jgi:transcription factor CON7
MSGQYQSPATTVSSASPINASAGSRPGQVRGGDAIMPIGGSALLRQPFDPPVYLSDPDQKVYSFVPIPGAQQHKRPRRRYEEIERMYKCGWQGCEKAYGTLNHLNAHVTMQSHGQKRTPEGTTHRLFGFVRKVLVWVSHNGFELVALHVPGRTIKLAVVAIGTQPSLTEPKFRAIFCWTWYWSALTTEFKEIRKEWKARKKEEENARKAAEDRDRTSASASQVDGQPADPSQQGQAPNYPGGVRPHLPPIGYTSADAQAPGQYGGQQGGMVYGQGNGQMGYPAGYNPHSPYPGAGGQVYQQRESSSTVSTSGRRWWIIAASQNNHY